MAAEYDVAECTAGRGRGGGGTGCCILIFLYYINFNLNSLFRLTIFPILFTPYSVNLYSQILGSSHCLRFILYVAAAFALCACDYKKGDAAVPKPSAREYPTEVLRDVNALAEKYFKGADSAAKRSWIDGQLKSYDAINAIVPDIPIQVFGAIKDGAVSADSGDWSVARRRILAQIDGYKRAESIGRAMNRDAFEFSSRIVQSLYPDDYVAQARELRAWGGLCDSLASGANIFSSAETGRIKERIASDIFKGGYSSAARWLGRQQAAKRRISSLLEEADAGVRAAFGEAEKANPADFERQLEELGKIVESGRLLAAAEEKRAEEEAKPRPQKLDKSRFSIFTARGLGGKISTAVLVKMNGKEVVLCSKEFFGGEIPCTIGNSMGEIKCSRAFISRDYPLIMLVPDSVPDSFVPYEVVGPSDMPSVIGKTLSMIAPVGAGFAEIGVRVFSEDRKYLNLTSDTAPKITKTSDIKRLDRSGDKFLFSTKITVEAGENSIVTDPDTGKIVSMAFRKYNPGVLSWTGKTGSIVGGEKTAIPDANTFIRQFDGATKFAETPDSSIQFIRMTALGDWSPLDPAAAARQKTELRRFTDDNNDFLMFFKRNLYGDMLRSRRLGQIAERYRRAFTGERMDRISYERNYKKYMLDIMYAMRREISQYPNANSFYPIYRDEMEYQIAFRKAMHDYLAEVIKSGDITNIVHLDLRARYSDPMSIPEGQLAPMQAGGSIGGGF